MNEHPATISIVIVAWNSSEELASTIPAVLGELAEGDELVVVDNASADRTAQAVTELAPQAVLVREDTNLGFAGGVNRGVEAASGELVVVLNPDAVPRPGFREGIVRPLTDGRGWAAWQGLVTAEDGAVVNTAGGALHFTGVAWAGGAGDPVPAGLEPREVPFLSGACLAVPRETWLRIGGFDEGYFLYHEDVEVSLRLRLEGGRVGLEPSAVVDHDYEFSATPAKYRYLERNRWTTVLRTYPGPLLAAVMPAMIATELAMAVIAAAGGWGRLKVAAWGDTMRALPATLRERRAIQARRRITAGEFAAFLTPDLDSPYLGRTGRIAPLRWALRGYWAVARALLR
ncbi:MAG: glycosyltransferase family 2 protein [Solirubrobacterales bacterium]|nr:glycosyltransferase family 2 protein [Solirubrobacterales bacterium]